MTRTRYIFICFLFLLCGPAFTQQYNIKSYTTRNGLANSIVNDIFIDSRGYLWFATQGGVSRFDGKIFENYSSKQGLPGNDITNICEDGEGNIWIATNGYGVSKFDGLHFTNYTKKDGLGADIVYYIFCDSKKQLWFATFGGGISKFDPKGTGEKKFNSFTTNDGLPTNEFFVVTEDKFGNMWFGSKGKGLIRYNGHNFNIYTTAEGLTYNSVYSLYFDKDNELWIGTTAGGACKMDPDGTITPVEIPGFEKDLVFSILQDQHDNIWFAAEHGLAKYDGRKFKVFTEQEGVIASYINSICEDYEGNIWIATGSGISMFKNEAFVTFTDKEGLSSSKVTTECEDAHGNIIIGTNGAGLNMLTGDKVVPLKIKELDQSITYSLFKDSDGKIWVGTESSEDGIIILEYGNGTYHVSRKIKSLNGKDIKTVSRIIEDKDHNIWVAAYGLGVFKISGETSESYSDSTGLTTNNIFTLFADSKGNVWIGTSQGGVIKYNANSTNGKKFTVYTKNDGLGDNSVWAICEDAKGNIYFGTNENGVTCYDPKGTDGKKFRSITTADGLASDLVYALIPDSKDRLWIGTEKGIDKISFGKDFSIAGMKYYGEGDGLKGIEVSQHGFIFDKEKTLWIATNNGLTRYNSKYDYLNSTPPRLIMSNVKLYFQNVDWKKYSDRIDSVSKLPTDLSLSYKDNHLTFDFRALTTGNVLYQYKLDGLDDDWSPRSSNTEAVYTNIPPGKYTFRVKAVNSDDTPSKDELTFSFTITPPFWQTWWFYTICIIVAGGAVIGFINYRTAQLAKEKKILEEKVEERTVELQKANDQLSVAYTEIKDSINYAKRIQDSILPLEDDIKKAIPEHFILFKPRDVVSGDFYWFYTKSDLIYIAACDCTGHGVPGAFMSIIGSSLLNEVMNETDLTQPAQIMDLLREKLIYVLKQQTSEIESKDGMDMVLCCIDKKKKLLHFAGANNPLYFVHANEITEHKVDKQPVGVHGDVLKPFTDRELPTEQGDVIYIFTDGYPDQFGGDKGKKFMYKRFKETLLALHKNPMHEQRNELEKAFNDWKADHEQVDDVLVIGIRI
jgi:ligand-binding sensor domain-containing protein/serine phosphatase RsbU (regulator of sigma subunit)